MGLGNLRLAEKFLDSGAYEIEFRHNYVTLFERFQMPIYTKSIQCRKTSHIGSWFKCHGHKYMLWGEMSVNTHRDTILMEISCLHNKERYARICYYLWSIGEQTDDVTINNIFLRQRQRDPMLPWACSVTDHRRRQNVEKSSVTHSAGPCVPLFCSYPILKSSVIY